jgi:DNA-binding response OmpR family regulator
MITAKIEEADIIHGLKIGGDDYDAFDRTIDAHIKKLRAKLGDDSRSPKYITTVYGIGYRIGGNDEKD